ncbi:hypothetical protein JG687_00007721 [Phytophthora cactorum]|uniref:Uncharacterized protein n=1 Tax=Phytophthora cactorum TaxID=29920 RepID=A0A329S4W6_9STRA|nr:hypothetical protein Pcac1_g19984 [Phytophthora cactorum]KAG2795967.1 hypothetical protein PC112_g22403 [Phytophthora cactorum]KAG2798273.1 hypothetical protein PC111_g20919 [Phytophthora cactorum]KAG2829436.1 hypothetical protein PC113_g21285 [Phytophthora cactorum]KAG2874601.1 hypothetical protein PC114_g25181 [Phytophthora cactorum]
MGLVDLEGPMDQEALGMPLPNAGDNPSGGFPPGSYGNALVPMWYSGISKSCEIARSNFQHCPDTD